MRRAVLTVLACALAAVSGAPAFAGTFERTAPAGQCRVVHGRMAFYNGSFSYRIWVIGTHRVLGVVDATGRNVDEVDALPRPLPDRLRPYQGDPWRPWVYGDFKVCAFTRQKPGVMQRVTLEAARNLVITD